MEAKWRLSLDRRDMNIWVTRNSGNNCQAEFMYRFHTNKSAYHLVTTPRHWRFSFLTGSSNAPVVDTVLAKASNVRNHCCSANTIRHVVCCGCWVSCQCQLNKNGEGCTTVFLWQIYIVGNSNTYVGLNVKCPVLQWNKRMFSKFLHQTMHKFF